MSREPGEAPGLEWKKRLKDGAKAPRWEARKKAVALGYCPSVIQLDIDANDHAALAARCQAEWGNMEAWLANEGPAPVFDGTLASLIDCYSRDEESRYHDLRHRNKTYLRSAVQAAEDDGRSASDRQAEPRGFSAMVS